MSDISWSIKPQNVTAGKEATLSVYADVEKGQQVTLFNDQGITAKDIPDINSGKTLEGVNYYYLYFEYGDTSEALMEGDGSTITETLENSSEWDIIKHQDGQQGTYWGLIPKQTMVLEAGSGEKQSLIVSFSDIMCNDQVGETYMYVKHSGKKEQKLPIQKYPTPNVSDVKIETGKPYYIGNTASVSWKVEGHANFTVKLDGTVVTNPQQDTYHQDVQIRYGEYKIEVINKINDSVLATFSFELDIIKKFAIDKISKSQVTLEWEVEEKNADECQITELATANVALNDTATFDTTTDADRDFKLSARVKGTNNWVDKPVSFKMPVIKSFSKQTTGKTAADCRKFVEKYGREGFLTQELVKSAARQQEICTPFRFSCKGGGGGGTTYTHAYQWAGENVQNYYLQMDSGEKFGPYDSNSTTATVTTTSNSDAAKLIAEGQGGYQVELHN